VYPADADSMPTQPSHIANFMRACCAQVAFQIGNNDPKNLKPQYSSIGLAGVTQARAISGRFSSGMSPSARRQLLSPAPGLPKVAG